MAKKTENIKKSADKLESDYEYLERVGKNYEAVKSFIGFLRMLEECLSIREDQVLEPAVVGEKISLWKKDKLKATGAKNVQALDMVYNDFKGLFLLDGKNYENTEKLLENYKGCAVCEQFIIFLRDLFSALSDFSEKKITLLKAREVISSLCMDVFIGSENMEEADFKRVYNEFVNLIERR